MKGERWRWILGVLSCMGLVSVYIFQDAGFGEIFLPTNPDVRFIVVKIFRFFFNDLLALLLIWSLFPTQGHLTVAVLVQIFGLCFFFAPYLILKIVLNAGDGPLISFLHRLVLNPTLLLLLIPAFWMIDLKEEKNNKS